MKTLWTSSKEYKEMLRSGKYMIHHVAWVNVMRLPGMMQSGYMILYSEFPK